MTTRINIPRWSRPYASVRFSGGPSRVKDEPAEEGWEPMPFLGFGAFLNEGNVDIQETEEERA